MDDTFTRAELARLLDPHRAPSGADATAYETIGRSLGLIGDDRTPSSGEQTARHLAAVIVEAAQTSTTLRGLVVAEESGAEDAPRRVTVLSGPLGHVALWEGPDGRFKVSVAGARARVPDPGVNLAAHLRRVSAGPEVSGTFCRLSSDPAAMARLTVDTSFQFSADGPHWLWRPDAGDEEAPFGLSARDDVLSVVAGANPRAFPSPVPSAA